ncbi:MAG TPA: head GIN domain-containing protein [Cyclobacteriaceae bacterium]|nr:head GIN domain-containing protein [Cyclobacteriaceae bacterium]
MKKIFILLSFVLLITSAAYAQKRETRDVSTFTKISFRTAGKIYVKQGGPQKVEIEGSAEMLEKIKTKVEDGRLVIGPEGSWRNWNWSSDESVTVYVTLARVDGLAVSGSGELIAQTKITGTTMDLDVSGSGTLTAEVEAGDVDTDVSGSGEINLKGKFKNVKADVSGSGRVSVNGTISGRADFEISGSGKVEASGTADSMSAEISGSGKVLGANLVTNMARIDIAGSGDVEITVNKDLNADISGSGTVRYKGNPARVNSNASGSGNVKKM